MPDIKILDHCECIDGFNRNPKTHQCVQLCDDSLSPYCEFKGGEYECEKNIICREDIVEGQAIYIDTDNSIKPNYGDMRRGALLCPDYNLAGLCVRWIVSYS